MSSRRPRNGLINDAPAFAATIACAAEKQRVTFTRIPSSDRCRVAFNPSRVSGHLITTFGAIFEYSRPSRTIPSLSWLVTSAETGPWTISQIAAMCCLKSTFPSFAIREGLVVTPSARPNAAPSRISLRFAVSRKNFIAKNSSQKMPHQTHRSLTGVWIKNLITQHADACYFNFNRIAVPHSRNARWRSCCNQVAGIQSHDLRDVPYKKGDRKCHVSRVTFLFYFTIQTSLNCNIVWIEFCLNPRPDRAESLKRLAACELNVFSLQVSRSNVVNARVTKNITQRIVAARKLSCESSDYNAELAFVLDLL